MYFILKLVFWFYIQQLIHTAPYKYEFTTENIWLLMPDGIRLSATLTIPVPTYHDETFPVLLEYKPYRKDDSFYHYNQPNNQYLAKRGFIVAIVDIRGTGSSEGFLIEHEYTTQELDDCEHVIEQLANHSLSNGRVGMFGISWSAFNSLMMATVRRPPALRAIFAAHGSEDLYNNDIHYGNGILHQDEYILSVDHKNALPASPNYTMDEQWIKQRFTRRPWIDFYLEHQSDSSFWRKNSIKYAYDNLTIPVYLVAGLYDAYKDFALNIYERASHVSPKIKVVVGPYVHAMPESSNRNPGPGFDGKAEMVRWFDYWLKDEYEDDDCNILNEPDITLFIRKSLTKGFYRYERHWPVPRQQIQRLFMSNEQKLVQELQENDTLVDTLEYRPGIGYEGGSWLGGLTGDQRSFDKDCLIYESDLIDKSIEIVGFVNVSLQVSTTARLAHWVVRLEDVDIDGQVWLVTTGAINGAKRQALPAYLEPDQIYTINFKLHFTTWIFLPGHRIRIAISNAMFYSNWPTPFLMNTSLYINSSDTFIDLPIIPKMKPPPSPPHFTRHQIPPTDIVTMPLSGGKPKTSRKYETDLATTITFEQITYDLLPNGCFISGIISWNYTCSNSNPADVRWTAQARQIYVFDMYGYTSINDIPMKTDNEELGYPNVSLSTRRYFELATELIMYSDKDYFYINLKRELWNSNQTRTNEPWATFKFNGKHSRRFH